MSSHPIEVVLLGTGTSSSVPHIDCITAHAIPGSSERPPCRTCLSTIDGSAEGKKNIRRNTSMVVRMPGKQGSVTVLIDCGKNFQAAALEWFPKYGLRQIDAVLITHAHADAINGLDDLRAWTLSTRIQPHIDLYVSEATYQDIKRMFPYLVSKEFASGGGDIPEFVWHVCIDNAIPFEINDTSIMVTPFLVHHGRLFLQPPSTTPAPVPSIENSIAQITLGNPPAAEAPKEEDSGRHRLYLRLRSDSRRRMELPPPLLRTTTPRLHPRLPPPPLPPLSLRARAIRPSRQKNQRKRTYLLGFSHEVAHDEYVRIGEVIGGGEAPAEPTENELKGIEMIGKGDPIWVRPAHDGLKIEISPERLVKDQTYG
ncbi:Lactamase-B domain-containing protein [Mycena venus]|uniref:Lactamase-B domain-containing protein n=1 Tax=Mycena venus TaxID=2733690 RepID=A0A8H6XFZ0_9AGAR|nr:Lactamase-B domain-containing protein [Mycena venus]